MSGANSNSVVIRSFLFAPANRVDLVKKFLRIKADCFVIDLEDSTPEPEKESARETALEGVRFLRDKGVESLIFIRTNSPASKHHREDLRSAVVAGVDGVVISKLGVVEEVEDAERVLASRQGSIGVSGLRIIAGIETALGVQNAIELVAVSDRICAVYFGAEDFAVDMGTRRTTEGFEGLYARSRVVLGARLAGVTAIDQAVAEIRDDERGRAVCQPAQAMAGDRHPLREASGQLPGRGVHRFADDLVGTMIRQTRPSRTVKETCVQG